MSSNKLDSILAYLDSRSSIDFIFYMLIEIDNELARAAQSDDELDYISVANKIKLALVNLKPQIENYNNAYLKSKVQSLENLLEKIGATDGA